MNLSAAEIESILTSRLESFKTEKASLKESFLSIDGKIELLRAQKVQVPRETEEDLVKAMQKLEHKHATTSGNNAEERQFMRDMDKFRQKKKDLALYLKVQGEIDELRVKRSELQQKMRDVEASLDEIYDGLRKIKLAGRLGCISSEILEQRITIEEAKISRVVGRGGSNLRNLETECGVTLDLDRTGGGIRILGTKRTLEAGYAAIMAIVETCIEEFELPDETIACLLFDKAALVNDMQTRLGIRIDVSRAKGVCKITGLAAAVQEAKKEISALDSGRTDIMIETSALSSIIGKSGANIKSLESAHRVAINLNREANLIEIRGRKADVKIAAEAIKLTIVENKEIEEVIKLEKHVLLGSLMGSGGSILRNLNKEWNVRIEVDGDRTSAFQSVKIRGGNSKVLAAKDHILSLVEAFLSATLVLDVPQEIMPLVIGKAGSGIKNLREKYPDANIDIGDHSIHIQCEDETVREAIRTEIEDVVDANYTEKLALDEDTLIQLKSQKGAETRETLTKGLQLRLNIEKDGSNVVSLRGAREKVFEGILCLRTFASICCSTNVAVSEGDFPILFKGGEESLIRGFERKFGVDIQSNRKDNLLYVRGTAEASAEAADAIEAFLEGEETPLCQLVQVDNIVQSAVIGKAGGNVKKMEEAHSVNIDILKARSMLRIRGSNPEQVAAARDAVLAFVESTRVVDTVPVPLDFFPDRRELGEFARKCADIFQIEASSFSPTAATMPEQASSGPTGDKSVENGENDGENGATTAVEKTGKLTNDGGKSAGRRGNRTNNNSNNSSINNNNAGMSIMLKGLYPQVMEARTYMLAVFSGGNTNSDNNDNNNNNNTGAACAEVHVLISAKHAEAVGSHIEDNFRHISDAHNVEFALDSLQSSRGALLYDGPAIRISGRNVESVSAAREQAVKMLMTLFPTEISYLQIPQGCQNEVFPTNAALKAISAATGLGKGGVGVGAKVYLDRPKHTLHIVGDSAAAVTLAIAACKQKVQDWLDLHATVPIEEFMLPIIVGKGGVAIKALQAETKIAKIEINRNSMVIELKATEKSQLLAAKELIEAKVAKLRREHWEVEVSAESFGFLIGKQGATIKNIRAESGASVEIDPKKGTIAVQGEEEKVEKAKALILATLEQEARNRPVIKSFSILSAAAPVIIGPKGATAREIQDSTGAKVDIDRDSLKCVVKGSEEACTKAVAMVEELLEKEGLLKPPADQQQQQHHPPPPQQEVGEGEESRQPAHAMQLVNGRMTKVVLGASPEQMLKMQQMTLSKSALRRMRRREHKTSEREEEGEDDGNDDYGAVNAVNAVDVSSSGAPAAATSTTSSSSTGEDGDRDEVEEEEEEEERAAEEEDEASRERAEADFSSDDDNAGATASAAAGSIRSQTSASVAPPATPSAPPAAAVHVQITSSAPQALAEKEHGKQSIDLVGMLMNNNSNNSSSVSTSAAPAQHAPVMSEPVREPEQQQHHQYHHHHQQQQQQRLAQSVQPQFQYSSNMPQSNGSLNLLSMLLGGDTATTITNNNNVNNINSYTTTGSPLNGFHPPSAPSISSSSSLYTGAGSGAGAYNPFQSSGSGAVGNHVPTLQQQLQLQQEQQQQQQHASAQFAPPGISSYAPGIGFSVQQGSITTAEAGGSGGGRMFGPPGQQFGNGASDARAAMVMPTPPGLSPTNRSARQQKLPSAPISGLPIANNGVDHRIASIVPGSDAAGGQQQYGSFGSAYSSHPPQLPFHIQQQQYHPPQQPQLQQQAQGHRQEGNMMGSAPAGRYTGNNHGAVGAVGGGASISSSNNPYYAYQQPYTSASAPIPTAVGTQQQHYQQQQQQYGGMSAGHRTPYGDSSADVGAAGVVYAGSSVGGVGSRYQSPASLYHNSLPHQVQQQQQQQQQQQHLMPPTGYQQQQQQQYYPYSNAPTAPSPSGSGHGDPHNRAGAGVGGGAGNGSGYYTSRSGFSVRL